jgi:2-succinyl-5-enolpyruvyl-6-hydroxy-3-cyclohexene-1-carboxylate synthase
VSTAPNPSTALARTLFDELVRCGLRHVVVAPGSRSTALAVAAHADPRLAVHVHPDERSAGFVALGLARATGLPAVVVTTSGSAVANLHPAVVEADTDRVPLLLLTADRPIELRATGANQAIDQVGLFGRAARWAVDLPPAEDRPGAGALWRSTADRAWAAATGTAGGAGAPGPVQCNVAFREPTVEVGDDGRSAAPAFTQPLTGRPGGVPWLGVRGAARVAADIDLQTVAARIAGTERGLMVLGGGSGARLDAALAVAEAAGWPVIAEPHSGGRRGPTAIAHAPLLLGHAGFARAHTPDLVLRVGRTTVGRELAQLLGPAVPQVLVDVHGGWADPARAVSELVVADPDRLFADLATVLPGPASSQWLDGWRAADAAAAAAVERALGEDPSEPQVARDLHADLPDGARLHVASSMPIRDLDAFAAPRVGLSVTASRGASGIDGTLSTALGVALGHDGPTALLTGDLAFLHDTNGFLLSPDAPTLDLVVLLVDNDGGGIFHFLPQAEHVPAFERLFGTPHGRDLGALAEVHGATVHRPADRAAVRAAVAAGLAAGGLHVVHVRSEREENVALHRRLRAEVVAALDTLA